MRVAGIFNLVSTLVISFQRYARFAFGQVKFGNLFPEPLQQDSVLMLVIVLDDLLLVFGILGHDLRFLSANG